MEGENNQERPKLCVSGCGFFGHQSYEGCCSKCFKGQSGELKFPEKGGKQNNHLIVPDKLSTLLDQKCVINKVSCESQGPNEKLTETVNVLEEANAEIESSESSSNQKRKCRCHLCNKKVGLMGFNCRCGHQFCALHRYAEMHSCSYDYREEAQEEIRKANPVVIAKKVDKI